MESTRYLASEAKWGPWFSALRHLKYSDRLIHELPWGGLQRVGFVTVSVGYGRWFGRRSVNKILMVPLL